MGDALTQINAIVKRTMARHKIDKAFEEIVLQAVLDMRNGDGTLLARLNQTLRLDIRPQELFVQTRK